MLAAKVLLIQQFAKHSPLPGHVGIYFFFLALQFTELLISGTLSRGKLGKLAVAVADGSFGFAQCIRGFGFGLAGFIHFTLYIRDTFAQIFQLFLLAGICHIDQGQTTKCQRK